MYTKFQSGSSYQIFLNVQENYLEPVIFSCQKSKNMNRAKLHDHSSDTGYNIDFYPLLNV